MFDHPSGKKIPVRFWIAVMMFFTTYINYTTLVNMSILIIAMTGRVKTTVPYCLQQNSTKRVTLEKFIPTHGPQYGWGEQLQSHILGSFFWGHLLTSGVGGTFAEYWGAFHVILWSTLGTGIFNSLTVFATYWHVYALIVCRFTVGIFQGTVSPALQNLVSKWAPPEEKGRFLGCFMGNTLSTAITWPLLGYVLTHFRWEWGFHIISVEIFIYCLVFGLTCSDSPDDHKFISQEERDFIKKSQGDSITKKRHFPPFRAMFTNGPFWILNICFFGNLWGLFLQLELIPKYMAEVIGFDLKDTGLVVSLPHIVRLISGTGIGFLGDYLETHALMSNNAIRKFFILFSHIIPGILLSSVALCGCDRISVITLLTLSMGFNGAISITCMQNAQDLAPNFAGTIYGMMHLIGGTSGFMAPAIIGITIKHKNGVKEWGYNFILGGTIYVLTGVIFIIFGSVEEQPWNRIADEERVPAR